MGLRLVAHYFDPIEALIALSVIDAAGVPCFVHRFYLSSIQPDYTMALGGYRLMVHVDDVEAAIDVIVEARANPLLEGECYVSTTDVLDRALSLLYGWLASGAAMPVRRGVWEELQ